MGARRVTEREPTIRRRRLPLGDAAAAGCAAALLLFTAGAARGQISADQVRQRYDRQSKGTSVEEFAKQMDSDDPTERLKGVKSMSESTDPKAIEYLVQALGDSDMRIKAKAIDACGNLRATDATPVLIQQLFLRTTDPEVKQRILAALGKIGDARAAKPIQEFLGRDLDLPTKGTALYALGDIGDPDSIEFLQTTERDEPAPTIKRIAREAEGKIRYQQAQRQTEAKQPLDTFLPPEPPAPQ
jgi:HEAT repeat protein